MVIITCHTIIRIDAKSKRTVPRADKDSRILAMS